METSQIFGEIGADMSEFMEFCCISNAGGRFISPRPDAAAAGGLSAAISLLMSLSHLRAAAPAAPAATASLINSHRGCQPGAFAARFHFTDLVSFAWRGERGGGEQRSAFISPLASRLTPRRLDALHSTRHALQLALDTSSVAAFSATVGTHLPRPGISSSTTFRERTMCSLVGAAGRFRCSDLS